MNVDESEKSEQPEFTNGGTWGISYYTITTDLLDLYGLSFLQQFIAIIYFIYARLTFFNLIICLVKYVPTGIYMYKFMKNIYVTSRERLKQKQTELEDIQLQIQIVNTKLCVRDAEFVERAGRLKSEAARLRRVRGRVRDLISSDDALRCALNAAAECDSELDFPQHTSQEEDNEFIMELLKNMKRDHYAISEPNSEKMNSGEPGDSEAGEQSLYSSLSDVDVRQDCQVKIVKVTNVYKVAYLKHYIKQKRLRRACKRAMLKKKMDNIKKLLEDWQKTLSMVINSKLTILNIDPHPIDVASQDAMGDYSKPQEYFDTDGDLRNDMFYDDAHNWPQRYPYIYGIEEVQDTAVSRDYYEHNNGDVRYSGVLQCRCKMSAILEETGSQIAIEDVTSECGDDCRRGDEIVAI